jgi:hypothetical protein
MLDTRRCMAKAAFLWLVLREHIPDTGLKIEDIFAGKEMIALFEGDPRAIADYTLRESLGLPQEEYPRLWFKDR